MINQKFGNLIVIECVGSNRYGKIWKCKCECGNFTNVVSARLKNGTIRSCGCSKSYEKLDGKLFGRLFVEKIYEKNGKQIKWYCKCKCGNNKIVDHYHLKSGHTKSCGCLNKDRIKEANTLNLNGKKYNLLTPLQIKKSFRGKVYWRCKCDCGNECVVLSGSIVSGNTKSCGCFRKNQKRENHPRWNPKISNEERETKRKYNTEDHKKWRSNIFTRDNFTCQLSGQLGGQLVAHHIESWDKNKNLRFDLNNGITISRKLHIMFHKTYGYGNNTKKQFDEFKIKYVNTNKKIIRQIDYSN